MGIQELKNETRASMKQAAASLADPVDPSTVRRWCTRGVRGVELEHYLEGGRIYTSLEAVERFMEKLNDSKQSRARGNR